MMLMPANASNAMVHYLAGAFPGKVGWLIGPSSFRKTKLREWMPYALDNDAYQSFISNKPWDELAWLDMLQRSKMSGQKPLWALVPDVVADRDATLTNWEKYAPVVRRFGFDLAFAAQDGMTPDDVPKDAQILFVGGTTEWKWRSLPVWCSNFSRVHVGRVNELRRLWTCEDFGVESVDGSGWFRGTSDGRQANQIMQWINGNRQESMALL